jgi:hypothetical protein
MGVSPRSVVTVLVVVFAVPMVWLFLMGLRLVPAVVWDFNIAHATFLIAFGSLCLIAPQAYLRLFGWIYEGTPDSVSWKRLDVRLGSFHGRRGAAE